MNRLEPENYLSAISDLETISRRLAAAAETEDLDAVRAALTARSRALRELPVAEVTGTQAALASAYENGERALASLADLKLHLQTEHARLAQMRQGFLDSATSISQLDLHA